MTTPAELITKLYTEAEMLREIVSARDVAIADRDAEIAQLREVIEALYREITNRVEIKMAHMDGEQVVSFMNEDADALIGKALDYYSDEFWRLEALKPAWEAPEPEDRQA